MVITMAHSTANRGMVVEEETINMVATTTLPTKAAQEDTTTLVEAMELLVATTISSLPATLKITQAINSSLKLIMEAFLAVETSLTVLLLSSHMDEEEDTRVVATNNSRPTLAPLMATTELEVDDHLLNMQEEDLITIQTWTTRHLPGTRINTKISRNRGLNKTSNNSPILTSQGLKQTSMKALMQLQQHNTIKISTKARIRINTTIKTQITDTND